LIQRPVRDALQASAAYAREHAGLSVWDRPTVPTSEDRRRRREAITSIATRIEALAARSLREPVGFSAYEALFGELRELGFAIDGRLVSAATFALHRDVKTRPLMAGVGDVSPEATDRATDFADRALS